MSSFTVSFYDPSVLAEDSEGRTLEDILAFSDHALEYHHDFIQYLFPLPERSPINPSAPVLNEGTRDAFVQRPELRAQMWRAVARMARFYGFEVSVQPAEGAEGKVAVFMRRDEAKWDLNSRLWITRFGHNHLRITRMIRCLRVLGMEALAQGFYRTLLWNDAQGKISQRTKMFWQRAATRGLHLAPEEEDEEARGVGWLRDLDVGKGAVEEADGGFEGEIGRMAVLAREEVDEVD